MKYFLVLFLVFDLFCASVMFAQVQKRAEPPSVQYAQFDIIADAPWRVKTIDDYIPFTIKINNYPCVLDYIVIYNIKKDGEKIIIDRQDFNPNLIIGLSWDYHFKGICARNLGIYANSTALFCVQVVCEGKDFIQFLKVDIGDKNIRNGKFPSFNNWYHGDTHFHSSNTDNILEFGALPQAILDAGKAIGLDWVTVTDHSTDLDDSKWAGILFESDEDFKTIRAEEVTIDAAPGLNGRNHFLVYNNPFFISGPEPILREFSDVLDDMQEFSFGFAAHPMDDNVFIKPWSDQNYQVGIFNPSRQKLIGLEVYNTRKTRQWNFNLDLNNDDPFSSWSSIESWDSELNAGITRWDNFLQENLFTARRRLFITGGSDGHGDFNYTAINNNSATDNAFGKVRTAVYCPDGFSEGNILNSLRDGHSVVTDGPMAIMEIDVNNDQVITPDLDAIIGDSIAIQYDDLEKAYLHIKWVNTQEFGTAAGCQIANLYLVSSKTTLPLWWRPGTKSGEMWIQLSQLYQNTGYAVGELNYYRLEAYTGMGDFRCYSNPIWIKIIDNQPPTEILADFEADITSGIFPLAVQFLDRSTATGTTINSWAWDFDNNGTIDSYDQNPMHVYTTAGTFSVKLFVCDGSLCDVRTKTSYILVSAVTPAKNIASLEYFIDVDPGLGNGIPIPSGSAPLLDIQTNINTSSLSLGLHRLYVRAKDEDGNWGIAQAISFLQQASKTQSPISHVEYFIDQDPGRGQGTTIPIGQANSVQLNTTLYLDGTSLGLHRLYLRGQDASGLWGIAQTHSFLLQSRTGREPLSKIAGIEYFYDADPGMGNGMPISVTSDTVVVVDRDLPSPPFQTGDHTLFIRAIDDNSIWGISQAQSFSITNIPMASVNQNNVTTTVALSHSSARNLVLKNRGILPLTFSLNANSGQKVSQIGSSSLGSSSPYEGSTESSDIAFSSKERTKNNATMNSQLSSAAIAGFAVLDSSTLDWLTYSPLSGTVQAGDSALIFLSMSSEGLIEGSYSINLHASTNDPNNSDLAVPINLQVSSEQQTILFDFPEGGWYLISLPVEPPDNSLASLFPSALAAFSWDGSRYVNVTNLEIHTGYWLAVPQAGHQFITGLKVWSFSSRLRAGWNLLGTCFAPLPITNPDDNPDGAILTPLYSYNASARTYESSLTLQPGFGYWVAAIEQTDLALNESTASLAKKGVEANRELFYTKFGAVPPGPPEIDWQTGELITRPESFTLYQNYPNPFNPTTTIKYDLPTSCHVHLSIFNIFGQQIAILVDHEVQAGSHTVVWRGQNSTGQSVASGLYFLKLVTEEYSSIKKMMLIR